MPKLFRKKNIKKGLKGLAVVVGVVFIFSVVLLLFFNNINTLFNITAHTEIVKFQTVSKPISRYNLNNASVYVAENYDFKKILHSFNGSLEINEDVNVEIERISNGAIFFSLQSENGNAVGNLYNNNNSKVYTANDYMLIEIHKVDSLLNNGISIVFPLSGIVEVGKSVDVEIFNETSPVLRSGDISMTGYSVFLGVFRLSIYNFWPPGPHSIARVLQLPPSEQLVKFQSTVMLFFSSSFTK